MAPTNFETELARLNQLHEARMRPFLGLPLTPETRAEMEYWREQHRREVEHLGLAYHVPVRFETRWIRD